MRGRAPSGWMAAFWLGLTAFWILFLAASPSGVQLILRVGLLVVTAALYLAIRRAPAAEGDGESDPLPERVTLFLAAVAILAAFGIFYYGELVEKAASGVLSLTMVAILMDNLNRRDTDTR